MASDPLTPQSLAEWRAEKETTDDAVRFAAQYLDSPSSPLSGTRSERILDGMRKKLITPATARALLTQHFVTEYHRIASNMGGHVELL